MNNVVDTNIMADERIANFLWFFSPFEHVVPLYACTTPHWHLYPINIRFRAIYRLCERARSASNERCEHSDTKFAIHDIICIVERIEKGKETTQKRRYTRERRGERKYIFDGEK